MSEVPLYAGCRRSDPGSVRDACGYLGTSLVRKHTPLGPFRRPMSRVIGGSWGSGRFLIGELPLHLGSKGLHGCKIVRLPS